MLETAYFLILSVALGLWGPLMLMQRLRAYRNGCRILEPSPPPGRDTPRLVVFDFVRGFLHFLDLALLVLPAGLSQIPLMAIRAGPVDLGQFGMATWRGGL